jgi:hypothetical protein
MVGNDDILFEDFRGTMYWIRENSRTSPVVLNSIPPEVQRYAIPLVEHNELRDQYYHLSQIVSMCAIAYTQF